MPRCPLAGSELHPYPPGQLNLVNEPLRCLDSISVDEQKHAASPQNLCYFWIAIPLLPYCPVRFPGNIGERRPNDISIFIKKIYAHKSITSDRGTLLNLSVTPAISDCVQMRRIPCAKSAETKCSGDVPSSNEMPKSSKKSRFSRRR
ncbi:hypothetical protein D9M69_602770 [compost metagenome]